MLKNENHQLSCSGCGSYKQLLPKHKLGALWLPIQSYTKFLLGPPLQCFLGNWLNDHWAWKSAVGSVWCKYSLLQNWGTDRAGSLTVWSVLIAFKWTRVEALQILSLNAARSGTGKEFGLTPTGKHSWPHSLTQFKPSHIVYLNVLDIWTMSN